MAHGSCAALETEEFPMKPARILRTFATSFATLAAAVLPLGTGAAEPVQARLDVSQQPAGPRIEPTVYGHFVEHLGRVVYDGLWVGPESPIPNTRGWRNDVVGALRQLGVPVMRWPGGCFADDYDWRDGIGDPAKRPLRLNKVWGGMESNRVGTHEFMDLAEMLGSEVYLAANMGSMPPRSMAEWLEYMTEGRQTALTDERRCNGRDKPWTVKYTGIGNESWGCGGHMRPEFQSDLHNQYATFLRAPTLRAASGEGGTSDHLVEVLMEHSGKHMDAFTLHYYTLPGDWTTKGEALGFNADAWAKTLKDAMGIETRIDVVSRIMDKHDKDKRVAMYVDEWGTWYDTPAGASALWQQNSLRDAMVAALSFNVFHRHTERVKMTNIAQMVNALQSPVLTDGPRMVLTPTYHAFDLYKPFRGATPLKARLQTPRWKQGKFELPAVDASVARGADGQLHLALVNLDPTRPARVTTNLKSAAQGRVLTAAAMDAHNTFDKPQTLVPAPYSAKPGASGLVLDLPPKSIVVVAVPSGS
jgi:alpha-N-arabinofuranosidase